MNTSREKPCAAPDFPPDATASPLSSFISRLPYTTVSRISTILSHQIPVRYSCKKLVMWKATAGGVGLGRNALPRSEALTNGGNVPITLLQNETKGLHNVYRDSRTHIRNYLMYAFLPRRCSTHRLHVPRTPCLSMPDSIVSRVSSAATEKRFMSKGMAGPSLVRLDLNAGVSSDMSWSCRAVFRKSREIVQPVYSMAVLHIVSTADRYEAARVPKRQQCPGL